MSPPSPSSTDVGQGALADFRLMAATYNGNPLESKIVLAFALEPFNPTVSRASARVVAVREAGEDERRLKNVSTGFQG